MKRTHLPLNGLRVLDAAARHLSFTRAADELAVTPAAVGQQNTGITEIFEAVKDLSRMMDETLLRVQSSDEASQRVREVAEHVTSVVSQYGAGEEPLRPAPATAEAA